MHLIILLLLQYIDDGDDYYFYHSDDDDNWWWWRFPRVSGFWENVRLFIRSGTLVPLLTTGSVHSGSSS